MNDRFSIQNVEEAFQIMASLDSRDQQAASALLYEWSQQPTSMFTALALIQNSPSEFIKYSSSITLSHSIQNFWGEISPDQRIEFRGSMVNAAISLDPSLKRTEFFIQALCHIVLFDWPEEWPQFSEIIFPSQPLNNSLKILGFLMEDIEESTYITDSRRNILRNFFVDQYQNVMEIIIKSLDEPILTVDALNAYSYILRWAPIEKVITFKLFQKLALEYLTNESTVIIALKCLTSVFIARTDSAIAFRIYSPFLARALSKGLFQNQRPITTNLEVIEFVIKFLHIYSSVFELVFIRDKAQVDLELISLLDDSVQELINTMQTKGISPNDLHVDLVHLFSIILSQDVDCIQENYWQLWDDILRRIQFESCHQMKVKPTTEFFMPMMADVRSALYNALPSAVNDEGSCVFQARTCMGALVYINQEDFVNFLKAQPPSPQLCYAIGTIEFVIDSDTGSANIDTLSGVINELLECSNRCSDQQFTIALLFGFSHSTRFFSDTPQLFAQFIEFVINCLSSNEKPVSTAATHALHYVVQRRVGLFKGDSRQFAELLIEQSERYLQNLDPTAAVRVFKVCTWLICYNCENTEMPTFKLFEKLLEPIVTVILNAGSATKECIETSLDIIRECSYASSTSVPYFFEIVWTPICQLAGNVVPNISVSNESLEYVLAAIAAIQVILSFDRIEPQISEIFQLMQMRGRIEECFFSYFALIRNTYTELNKMYPTLHEMLVIPTINSSEPIPAALFDMVGQFDPTVVDVEWLTLIAINAINDLRKDVCESALNALQKMMFQLDAPQYSQFSNRVAPQLIAALINSIIDLVHRQSFIKTIDFLRMFINSGDNTQKDQLKAAIANTLRAAIPQEPSPNFCDNFAEYVMSVQRQFFKFKAAFVNLLVVLRKASPGDGQLFEVEPVHTNSMFAMLFDSIFRDWGSMIKVQLNNEGIPMQAMNVMAIRPLVIQANPPTNGNSGNNNDNVST